MSIATVAAMLAVSADDADARGKRKRGPAKRPTVTLQDQGFVNAGRQASIVIDVNSGETLQESAPDALRYPASLTKIMTLYMLFEQLEAGKLKLHSQMEVSSAAAAKPPTKLGVRPGQTLAVEDAIKALVTKSANDAATVVAEALGGTEEEFAQQMTRKARQLGMTKTVYRNASGLPNPDQVTTARDQALLGIAIQQRFPTHYRYFSTSSFTFAGRAMRNHNKLLGRVEGVDGIKTGYTHASGFNLVSSVRRSGRHIVSVVLGGASGNSRDARMRSLIEGTIMEASAKRTAPNLFASAPSSAPVAVAALAPAVNVGSATEAVEVSSSRPQLASASSRPISLDPPTPRVPVAGSTDPIKPVMVRTVAVKMPSGKGDQLKPQATTQTAPIQSAPIQTASLGPVALPSHADALPAPQAQARPGVLGVLPVAMAAAGKSFASSANASEIKKPEAARNTPAPASGWAIQIGAFPAEAEAKKKLSDAKAKARTALKTADPYTEKTGNGAKVLYRARFTGFDDRDEAEAACKQLKRSDITCLPMKI